MSKSLLLGAIVAALGFAGPAHADIVEYTDSVALSLTNWDDSVTVPLLDPALGNLLSVSWELNGHVEGEAKFESLDASPATITMNLAAELELLRPDLTVLSVVLPLVATVDDADAFDGTIDFMGPVRKDLHALHGCGQHRASV